MEINSFEDVKKGFIFYLVGSDKPLLEFLHPNPVDQHQALKNQFRGMTDVPFDYADFEATRTKLIENVNCSLTSVDKNFLLSFESGSPNWDKCCAGDLTHFPAIQWKQQNIQKLKEKNIVKFNEGIEKLRKFLF